MTNATWKNLNIADEDAFAAARLQSHAAVQWLARLARTFSPAQPDYSHTSLCWDRDACGLFTQNLSDTGLRAGLSIDTLTLTVGTEDRLKLHSMKDADVLQWLHNVLTQHKLSSESLDSYTPEELTNHPILQGASYNHTDNALAHAELNQWFANADLALQKAAQRYGHIQPGPSPVRCWPHHFDIATLIRLEEGNAEEVRSIGVGLSPGDETYTLPYFYSNPWPKPESVHLPELHALGNWHSQGFFGAVATSDQITSAPNQYDAVIKFLGSSIAANLELLCFDKN